MNVKNVGAQIIEQERVLRDQLLKKPGSKLEDRIMRSFGILRYSRNLSTEEALQKLSDIRLGINLNLIPELTEIDINEMIIRIQPGNLQKNAGKLLESGERDMLRADSVRKYIEDKLGK